MAMHTLIKPEQFDVMDDLHITLARVYLYGKDGARDKDVDCDEDGCHG